MVTVLSTSGNRLLDALPVNEYEQLAPYLKPVSLKLSEVLFRPHDEIRYVHFPVNSIVSLLTDLADGNGLEVGLVGKEGMVGISVILGGAETKVATVQAAGDALRIEAAVLRREFQKGGVLHSLLLRYLHALMTQISQTVVCNARHAIDGRLSRWLLMYHDRLGADEFTLTHEFMANMLGVRRAGVTTAAYKLQQLGFIKYQRGHITILDRKGLEDYTCECYPVVKEKFDSFML